MLLALCASCGRSGYDLVDAGSVADTTTDVGGDALVDVDAAALDVGGDTSRDAGPSLTVEVAPALSIVGAVMGAQLGGALAIADVNGDGRDDVIVGAPAQVVTSVNDGRVFVHLAEGALIATTAASEITPADATSSEFGASLANVGDLNGDGREDVAVGAPAWTGTLSQQGRVIVLSGEDGVGLGSAVLWTSAPPMLANARLGQEVVPIGDVDGDGRGDLGIAAPSEPGTVGVGRVYVFPRLGAAFGAPVVLEAPDGDAVSFGFSLGGGDLDGGEAEVAIGCYAWGGARRGAVYGARVSPSSVTAPALPSADDTAHVGSDLAVGRMLGDPATSDVAVGAFDEDEGTGAVYVYADGALLTGGAPARLAAPVRGAHFGFRLATADIDRDGFDELLVGAYGDGGTGAVYVYSLARDGFDAPPRWRLGGVPAGAQLGSAIAAGDIDGSGNLEIVVGAFRQNAGAGAFHLFQPM